MTRIVSTDNPARRNEFKWLGPVNLPMPVPARGTSWLIGLVAFGPVVFTVGALTPQPVITAVVPGPAAMLVSTLLSLTVGAAVTVLLVRSIGRHITPTRPVKHHAALFMTELDDPREEQDEEIVITPKKATATP